MHFADLGVEANVRFAPEAAARSSRLLAHFPFPSAAARFTAQCRGSGANAFTELLATTVGSRSETAALARTDGRPMTSVLNWPNRSGSLLRGKSISAHCSAAVMTRDYGH
jgi:hypothetical protein